MHNLQRTNSNNQDFISLVKHLDDDLAIRDGEEHDFYHQFNNIDVLKYVVVVYDGQHAVGCGAFKEYESGIVEIKRMYTNPNTRGKGIASKILTELETWAKELGYVSCILETGVKMPEAIGLYLKTGYHSISNYGQYAGKGMSKCFEKKM